MPNTTAVPTPEAILQPRQCGRCRGLFAGDATVPPGALPSWWLCAPCREVLLGRGR